MVTKLLKPGTEVMTKHGVGVITEINPDTYKTPVYHILINDNKYEDEYLYIADPENVFEISRLSDFKKGYLCGYNDGDIDGGFQGWNKGYTRGYDIGYPEGYGYGDEAGYVRGWNAAEKKYRKV